MSAEPLPRRACLSCGSSIEHRRPQALTCGHRCRTGRHRAQRRAAPEPPLLAPAERWAATLGLPLRDFWGTPPEVVELGRQVCHAAGLHLAVDLAATAHDRVLPRHVGPDLGLDALSIDWPIGPGEAGWCNPPYSRRGGGITAWVRKALQQMELDRPSVLLVNVEPSAGWRPTALARADRYLEFTGRLAFVHPVDRLPRSGTRHSSALMLFHTGRGTTVEIVPRPLREVPDVRRSH